MTKRFECGLVVGKFAPLHRGHELVIHRALEACDEVILISYANPEPAGCSRTARDRWLGALFPTCRRLVLNGDRVPLDSAEDVEHRRFVATLCIEQLGVMPDAVFTSETYGPGFASELTAFFRERRSTAKEVTHVSVDPERRDVPIAGSLIRGDVHAHRRWLAPIVYASFVERVCAIGGESSGKSTLVEELGRAYGTEFVPEYGRELWEERRGHLVFDDMLRIAERQIELEESACLRANRFVFCDTSPLVTLFYSLELFGTVDPRLAEHAKRDYSLMILCAPDFPFDQDGTRRDDAFRTRQHAFYSARLRASGRRWMEATGSVRERVAQVTLALGVER